MYQPRATRVARALIVLAVTLVVMPVVFFLPPHLLWPIVVLGAGAYLARKYWVGEYHVRHFQGACPRCGTELEMKAGQRVRNGQVLECYGCHRQPRLVIDEPDD
ncbi:MAG: hypothetical protein GWM90_22375 [Gemmatimonadetes bacterium]|nr:hypothetical protein [Gemmatimonadota bacterium]NIQ57362.1 hypothetical protein [Gemmatimonadota bacterium]NIU77526.1 hypothetical protein [Gammaproteobacteria bacterium]NIX46728.1 hypothetical protein [Gemmatimonadota bacterium]NIY11075.1 hypothetical protein [Gemmatimonadota bacterium]